jgi:3-isopropylmalate dehydrogenase
VRALRIAVVPGDGIGVDVTAEAVKVLRAAAGASGADLKMTSYDWGADRYLKTGVSLPGDALQELKDGYDAILLGAMGDPRVPDNKHAADILLGLRFGALSFAAFVLSALILGWVMGPFPR